MHTLILGQTESGKTCLAREIVRGLLKNDKSVLIFDPFMDSWPDHKNIFVTHKKETFLDHFWSGRKLYAFMDEGGQSVGKYQADMEQCATRGRHWGHSCFFIAQRAQQISLTVRSQCSILCLFQATVYDCKIHARDWNDQALLTGSELAKGQYFYKRRFHPAQKRSIF